LVDVSDPVRPRAVSVLSSPENDPAKCRDSPVGTYTSHNPTLVRDLPHITRRSTGLQAFDLSAPAQPQRVAEFRPSASEPGQRDPQLGATPAMTWSYPIIRDGLIYVADINQGLYILRYQGPHSDELAGVAFAERNSNLFALAPEPSPGPAGPINATPPERVASTTHPAATGRPAASPPYIVAGAGVAGTLMVVALVSYSLLRRRRGSAQ